MVAPADGDIGHTPRAGGVSLMFAGNPIAPVSAHNPHGTIGLHVSRPNDFGLAHEIMCRMRGAADVVVSERSISLVRLAAPASAPDRGYYRAGRGPPLSLTQHRCPELAHPGPSTHSNAPLSSARR